MQSIISVPRVSSRLIIDDNFGIWLRYSTFKPIARIPKIPTKSSKLPNGKIEVTANSKQTRIQINTIYKITKPRENSKRLKIRTQKS